MRRLSALGLLTALCLAGCNSAPDTGDATKPVQPGSAVAPATPQGAGGGAPSGGPQAAPTSAPQ